MYAITRYPASVHTLLNKYIFKTLSKVFRFTKPSYTKSVCGLRSCCQYYSWILYIILTYQKYLQCSQHIWSMNTKLIYKRTFTTRPLGDRDPLPKKKKRFHKNTTPTDMVTVGQAWDSYQRPWISKPSLNYMLKTTEESQIHFPEGSKVICIPWKTKQNSDVFSGSFRRLRQSGMLSSNETLHVHSWAHPRGTLKRHICLQFSSARTARVLLDVPISVGHYSFFIGDKPKRMPGPPWCGQM